MANKYWYVAGNGNATWGNNGVGWYFGSGGTGGAAGNPTSADVAIFDAASGSGVCTVSQGRLCSDLIMTGYTGTITGSPSAVITIYGTTITLSTSGVFDPVNNPMLQINSGTTTTLTTNGQSVGDIQIIGNSTLVMADDLVCKNNMLLKLNYGTFTASNKNITIGGFTDENSTSAKTLNMGTGIWTLGQTGPVDAGEYVWNVQQPTYITVNASTSIIKILRFQSSAGLSTAITTTGSISTIVLRDIITSTAGSNWPTGGGTVLIGDELFTYTGISGSTLTGISRAAGGTTPMTYNAGTAVLLITPMRSTLSSALGTGDANLYITDLDITGGTHGYFLVDDEVISYTSRSAAVGSGYVSGLTRGITTYGRYHTGNIAHSSGVYIRNVELSIFNGGGKTYGTIYACATGNYQFVTCTNAVVGGIVNYSNGLGWRISVSDSNGANHYPVASGTITSAPSSINEGSSGTINATVYGRQAGATTYWDIVTNAGDFSTTTGSFTTSSSSGYNYIDGAPGSFSVTPTADNATEGAETFTARVRVDMTGGATGGSVVATTSPITINDTSIAPYAISGPTTIYPGLRYQYTITTSGVADGTVLYWQPTNVGVTSPSPTSPYTRAYTNRTTEDVINGGYNGGYGGSVTINNGTGTFYYQPAYINYSSGANQFKFDIRAAAVYRGYAYYTGTASIGSGNISITGATFWLSNSTVFSSASYANGDTIETNYMRYYDSSTNSTKTATMRVTITSYTPGNGYFVGTIIYSSVAITSTTNGYAIYGYGWHKYATPIITSDTISFGTGTVVTPSYPTTILPEGVATDMATITTTGYPTSTPFYWILEFSGTGYVTSDDFVATSGTVYTNSSGVATVSLTGTADYLTETYESGYFVLRLYFGDSSYTGAEVLTGYGFFLTDATTSPEEFLPFFL